MGRGGYLQQSPVDHHNGAEDEEGEGVVQIAGRADLGDGTDLQPSKNAVSAFCSSIPSIERSTVKYQRGLIVLGLKHVHHAAT